MYVNNSRSAVDAYLADRTDASLRTGSADTIEEYRGDDDAAQQYLLNVAADLKQVHGVGKHRDENRAQYGRNDSTDSALQTNPADHGGGDAFEHETAAKIGLARPGARGKHQRAKRRQQAAGDVSEK